MKAYHLWLATIVVMGAVPGAPGGLASAQGLEDLVGFWCNAGAHEQTQRTCIQRVPGIPPIDLRIRVTVVGGEILRISQEAVFPWEFQGVREQSSPLSFRGSETIYAGERIGQWPCVRKTNVTVAVQPSRKIMVYRAPRGTLLPVPQIPQIGNCSSLEYESEGIFIRME